MLASVTSQIPQAGAGGNSAPGEASTPSPLAAKLNTLLEMEALAVAQNRTTLVDPGSCIL